MELNELIEIYNDKIDFTIYWNKLIAPVYGLYRFPCKCILHDEQHGASFSYSYKLRKWQCFGRCKTIGKVVDFHLLYLRKSNEKVTLMSCLNSLYKMFPELHLPSPNQVGRITSEESEEASKALLKNKLINLITFGNNNSNENKISLLAETDDINNKILNIFIERRQFNEH